jgi:hypothetical protein
MYAVENEQMNISHVCARRQKAEVPLSGFHKLECKKITVTLVDKPVSPICVLSSQSGEQFQALILGAKYCPLQNFTKLVRSTAIF